MRIKQKYFYKFSSRTFSETVHFGAGNRTILVDANQVITYNLTSNDDNLLVDVGLDFPSPLAGREFV